ncbi:hypothetical protein RUND412_006819 [Rhizina undulata]
MPIIKFPKFSRRKSVGNALEAAYEPANPGSHFSSSLENEEHDSGKTLGYGGGGFGGQNHQSRYGGSLIPWIQNGRSVLKSRLRRDSGRGNTGGSGYSGADYYASGDSVNRFSSSSTFPSANGPQTPVSTEDFPRSQVSNIDGQKNGKHKSGKSYGSTVAGDTPPAGGRRSVGGQFASPPPRRSTMSTTTPPKLETSLDTSSLFGDDMFSFSTKNGTNDISSGVVTPTAPKIASNSIINTVSSKILIASGDNKLLIQVSQSDNHYDIPPVPPPKSYDPKLSHTSTRLQGNPSNAFSSLYTSSQHMDGDRPSAHNESSPYGWDMNASEDLINITSPGNSTDSPRHSRNLTPGQTIPKPSHSRTDSLSTPVARQTKSSRQSLSKTDTGLKRKSALVKRGSFNPDDEDAPNVADAALNRRSQTDPSISASSVVVGPAKGLTGKVKDRDSGWEETFPSGSSSANSLGGNSSSSSHRDSKTPMMSRGNTESDMRKGGSKEMAPKAIKSESGLVGVELRDDGNDIGFSESISAAAALASKYEEQEDEPPKQQLQPNKVMTPAQFERYRQEQDHKRLTGGLAVDDDSASESEGEDEIEKKMAAAKQRQKQEAHLAVYRQQMMKVTGSQPDVSAGVNSRPSSLGTLALPYNTSMPHLSISGPGSSGKSSEEEDEEVPLAILMAHGFPNKNRPPTRLSNASSQPNLRATAQAQDPRLPPFARHLPADPYNIGASILNPSNRMSLAYGVGSDARSVAGGSVSGGSMYNGMPPSPMPAGMSGNMNGGLIGEIMRTEEMKAARKNHAQYPPPPRAPFQTDPFGRPASPGGGLLGMGGGMQPGGGGNMMGGGMGGGMGPGHQGMGPGHQGMGPGHQGMGPGHQGMMGMNNMGGGMNMGMGAAPRQDQTQMASQMQMMQMQMQWMQMQMQNPQQQQQMLQPPMMGQRPNSMMSMSTTAGAFGNPMMPNPHQRTMSLMDSQLPQLPFQQNTHAPYAPSIGPTQLGGMMPAPQGYAPSIAPSERSTVGLPSRYRPVSYNPAMNNGRTSTLTLGTAADWNRKPPGSSHLKNSDGPSAPAGDEDDDEGWEELEKKRQEKKEGWRRKKEGLMGLFAGGEKTS